MNVFKTVAAVSAAALLVLSCGKSARIDGVLAGAPDSPVIVKLLDINTYKTLDTLKTNSAGHFSYKVPVEPAQPEFVYFFYGDTKVASAVVLPGDRIDVQADTLGHYTISGSEESALLQQVEQSFSSFMGRMSAAAGAEGPSDEINKAVSGLYIDYYRESVKYILTHPYSITSVPVCFHRVNDALPVFGQSTDAIHFRNLADSLSTVYPQSKYVKALRREADKRSNALSVETSLRSAKELSYPEIEMSDIHGRKVALTGVDAKVVLLHFWDPSDNAQKLLNNDLLLPLYNEYHDKGLEIYAVAIDTDKPRWASTVKNQKLPWINVCDALGAASPAVRNYALGSLPATFVIAGGEITTENVSDEPSLRAFLRKTLK